MVKDSLASTRCFCKSRCGGDGLDSTAVSGWDTLDASIVGIESNHLGWRAEHHFG